MTQMTRGVWQVEDRLIEQPSWGGRYIIDLKGLGDAPAWTGKKVGQSYELARDARLIDPAMGTARPLAELLTEDAVGLLGQKVVDAFGPDLNLLIKLTQAKGNSFQVHLPEGKSLKHWQPKPEAWFYLAPGLYTFGLKPGTVFDDYRAALHAIDDAMRRLGEDIGAGRKTSEAARAEAERLIRERDPYAYVNLVEAQTDDIVDLTAGGIHHSWEEDDARFPEGNLVYEVQVDVPDERCSMRGFDKGKFLPGGGLRATHVADYLATLETDAAHNDLSHHVRRPEMLSDTNGARVEALFRTPYFCLDRLTLAPDARLDGDLTDGFHHLFVHQGSARIGEVRLEQGRSYMLPAALGQYSLQSQGDEPVTTAAVLLKTFLPTTTSMV